MKASASKMQKAIRIGITLFWLLSMALLINTHLIGSDTIPSLPEALMGEKWMSIYRDGSKVGYMVSRLEGIDGGYKAVESSFMRLRLLNTDKEIRTLSEAYFDNKMALRSFSFLMEADMTLRASGIVEGKDLVVTMEIAEVKTTRRIRLKEPPIISLHYMPHIRHGESIRLPMLEPATLIQDVIELKFETEENLSIMGKEVKTNKLKGSFKGTDIVLWVTEHGDVVKEEVGGFTFIKEARDEALRLGSSTLDIALSSAVKPIGKLPPEGRLSFIKLKLKGINYEDFELSGGLQSLKGDVLEIKTADLSSSKDSPLEDTQIYLGDTIFIQSKDPEIADLANTLTAGAKDDTEKAHLIYKWVYENISKSPSLTLPTAKEVLKSRRGDCNEHTALYTALARAAGIPTKVVVGLVYRDGIFYYHAWPEVYIRGAWVPVEPTLGEFPADAGHIRLLTGDIDKQLQIISAIGKISIEILDFK